MRRFLLMTLGVVTCAVLIGAIGSAASAQGLTPAPIDLPECEDIERVDLNRDGRLDHNDFTLWVWTLHEGTGEQCFLGGPASGCPGFMDVNGDGIVDYGDLFELEHYQRFCINAPWKTIGPGG